MNTLTSVPLAPHSVFKIAISFAPNPNGQPYAYQPQIRNSVRIEKEKRQIRTKFIDKSITGLK